MTNEPQIILAFIFKKSGKKELSQSDLYLTLSMELQWFKPDDAKKFVTRCIKKNLLKKQKNSLLKPVFDIKNIDIPVGFKPQTNKVQIEDKKEKNKNIFDEIAKISKKSNKQIKNKIDEIRQEKKITFEVATILLAKEYNVEIGKYIKQIESKLE